MMLRWWVSLLVILGLSLGMVGGVLIFPRSPAYNHEAFKAFLTPQDCASPCFLNVEIGRHGGIATRNRLEKHPWVEGASVRASEFEFYMTINWSGQQPPFIDSLNNSFSTFTTASPVRIFSVPTYIRYGDIQLQFGGPDEQHVTVFKTTKGDKARVTVFYRAEALRFDFWLACPYNRYELLHAPARVIFTQVPKPSLIVSQNTC